MIWSLVLLVLFFLLAFSVGYLYLLVIGSCLSSHRRLISSENVRFAVAIPAHNEEDVIAQTVQTIRQANYPLEKLAVFVVADHCTDHTAQCARDAGAVVFEREGGERGGKGVALGWLFEKIWQHADDFEAVAVFDADTRVDAHFFHVMSTRIAQGDAAIQGNHVIRNPGAGWLPALTWAMFLIDNRFQNQGRAKLGFSAKNMGDSICFRVDLLKRYGWGQGLTEDYSFRQCLLMEGIAIDYEPMAIGYGDAAANWHIARAQRSRWIRGVQRANKDAARRLFLKGISRRSLPIMEGALQAAMPSYSTLTVLAVGLALLSWLVSSVVFPWLRWASLGLVLALFIFPLLNLALEKAPWRAYLVILTGPVYILWRTWLSLYARFAERSEVWVRTPRAVNHLQDVIKKDH